ncbi:serine hydrolase domain-containing protein [Nocardia bhagyanarayanae]|uniref:CubicO group peptidase (Beta-lactamase class C family) n=1 Tax=Nocardia bhagyanarayanae TaxID=1215925 RepID=A0A543FF77_9NOCA|nr:serine hydrolase domain-containing protein [Nocardia bhagyanarayanae]TQM32518.1 CubicO group peptidase (beta-lactamase class C family) [Nocardia bhagyanarayanae]
MDVVEDTQLAGRIAAVLNRHGVVGAAVGVVRAGRMEFVGHGRADIETQRPIIEDTIFRIASITKTFTAIAVMQLWERGLIDLDGPANDYLRAYRLVSTDPRFGPVTIRHLLTHTSGVGETVHPLRVLGPDFGESVAPGTPVPPLSVYYRGGLRVSAEPGTRWTYTNHGFATLGQIVADVSGVALAEYLREHVFSPLGMSATTLTPPGPGLDRATGYTLRAHGPEAVTHREMITAGAASIYSTPRDMGRYVTALLGGGRNEYGAVLRPDTLALMFAPQYQPDSRVPGMGLGFFRGSAGGHRVVEHQGILPGFDSQIWLAPDDGVGLMAFVTGGHQAMLWLPAETSSLLHGLLGAAEPAIRHDVAHHPEVWSQICGYYTLSGSPTDVRARSMVGLGVDVRITGGLPVLRVLTPIPALLRGLRLYPDDADDPFAFRIDLARWGLGTGRIVFGREARTGRMAMHFDLMPLTLRKTASLSPMRPKKVSR